MKIQDSKEFNKVIVDILLETGLDNKKEARKLLQEKAGVTRSQAKMAINIAANDFETFKNSAYPSKSKEEIKTENNSTQDIDYESMDLDELKKELEKEKMIAELKALKNNNTPATQKAPVNNKTNGEKNLHCPKCGSTSIQSSNKKISVGRGIVGGALLGPIGAGVGALTSKKIICKCLVCGHEWKIK